MYVKLGNAKAKEGYRDDPDGPVQFRNVKGDRSTDVHFGDDVTLAEAFRTITDPRGVWAYHARDDTAPTWVTSDSDGLAALLAEHYGCPVGAPDDVEATHWTEAGPPGVGPDGPVGSKRAGGGGSGKTTVSAFSLPIFIFFAWLAFAATRLALRTNGGADHQARVMADTASTGTGSYAAANYIAVTANTTAPAASDTTLTGEIATAGGGLIRAQAVYAHTNGTNTYTLTKTFTANGSDALPVTIGKIGVFNASSAGTMVFETLVSPTATLSASGDAVTLTETVTM